MFLFMFFILCFGGLDYFVEIGKTRKRLQLSRILCSVLNYNLPYQFFFHSCLGILGFAVVICKTQGELYFNMDITSWKQDYLKDK